MLDVVREDDSNYPKDFSDETSAIRIAEKKHGVGATHIKFKG